MEQANREEITDSEIKYKSGDIPSEGRAKEKLLNLSEASQLAGVSTATLMRFAEAGYFKIFNSDSEIKFSDDEIAQVFGVTFNYSRQDYSGQDNLPTESAEPAKNTDSLNIKAPQDDSTLTDKKEDTSSDYKTLASQIEVIKEIQSAKLDSNAAEISDSQTAEPLAPFKKVLQLQEELLTQKNTIIADLIKERDWLRTRLEKMEEKSERDQMLLMVESQKVRTLISDDADNQKKLGTSNAGFLNKALAWFK